MQNEMIRRFTWMLPKQFLVDATNQRRCGQLDQKSALTGRQLKQEGLVQHQVHLDAIDALIRKQLGGKFSLVHANKLKPSHSDRWGLKGAIIYRLGIW